MMYNETLHTILRTQASPLSRWLMGVACVVIMGLALVACNSHDTKNDPLLVRAPEFKEVEAMYEPYLSGDIETFVGSIHSAADKSDAYRHQVVNMMKQHTVRATDEHSGLKSISVIKVEQSQLNAFYADAYLLISYGDGTSEQVLQPLVYVDGKWWLR